jgi:SulP family sulfate permease
MPALGALLILAGIRSIKPPDARAVWRAGWNARTAAIATFVATLVLPIQAAVGLGVLISALLYVARASTDVSVVELIRRPDGRLEERTPPERLPGGKVTVLDIYGHVFFAGARTLERLLPPPGEERRPVVILRLRGYTVLGATMINVLSDYAERLRQVDGRLYLAGISSESALRLLETEPLARTGAVRVYRATRILGESVETARSDAEAWLAGKDEEASGEESTGHPA